MGRTSCGDVPILGDYWKATPSACGSCVDQTCCAEATACAASTDCLAYRNCLLSCTSKLDFRCAFACRSQHPHQLSDDLDSCIVGGCSSCVDVGCRDQAWTSPTASQVSQDLYINDFTTGKAVPGVTVKSCARTDAACASPLDQRTTDALGHVQLTGPPGPGGTSAYVELTGAGIQPEIAFGGLVDGDVFASVPHQVGTLDAGTASTLFDLAGRVPQADAGAPQYGVLTVLARSCKNSEIAGATVSSSNAGAAAVTSYLIGGRPSQTAAGTDSSGVGSIVNHTVGPTTVTVTLGGQPLGTESVLVRAGFMTTVVLPPGH